MERDEVRDLNDLAQFVAEREAGETSVDIAQISEIIRHLRQFLFAEEKTPYTRILREDHVMILAGREVRSVWVVRDDEEVLLLQRTGITHP